MPVRRIIPVVVAVLAVAVVAFRITGGAGTGSLVSLDSSNDSGSGQEVAGTRSQGQQGNRDLASATPGADLNTLDQASAQKSAFILLNPASATAGSSVGVAGSGFDPASVIDFYLASDPRDDQPQELGFAQADSGGSFGSFSFSVPQNYRSPTFVVIAKQRNSGNQAMATGRLEALRPSVKLGTNVGSVGDRVAVSAQGFMPGEEVKVFFNSLSGDAFQSYKASSGGTIEKETVKIPYGAVGNNSLIFVGTQSQSPVTVPFLMLTLYPNVALSTYATKADTSVAFSGSGFGPDEEVNVHLNNPQAPPIIKFKTNGDGTFENAGAFVIPFELTGKNTLIFVGEKSQATATAGFDVLPYTPNVQPSTYGGRPGTSITFYGDGFARNEIVRFYTGVTRESSGKEVACAKADDQGQIGAGGSYTIPPSAEAGQLEFTAVGSRSKASTTATVEVMDAGIPIQAPARPEGDFQCPFDQQEAGQQDQSSPPPPAQAPPPPPQRMQPGQTAPQSTPVAQPQTSPQRQPTPAAGQAQPRATVQPTATPAPTPRPQATRQAAPTPAPKPTSGAAQGQDLVEAA